MAAASIEVSGQDAERQVGELQAVLASAVRSTDSVSPVEMQRSAELAVAVVGLVFSGVDTAKTIWDWWQAHRSQGVTVRISLDDGTRVDLSDIDQQQLEIEFERRAKPGK